jgi:Tfp pilus assembly protein PilO
VISLQRQKIWAGKLRQGLITTAAVGLVTFLFFSYLPDRKKLTALEAENANVDAQLLKNQAAANDLETIKRDVVRLRDQITRSRQLPAQPDLPKFIRDVTALSSTTEMQKFRYEPEAKKQQALCRELPMSLMFEGRFLQVASFLRQMEEMPRMMRTRKVHIKSRDGKTGTVDVQITMSVFFGDGQ